MGAYLSRRLLTSALVLVGVSILTFSMLHLVPGDPVTAILGRQALSGAQADELRERLGLNDPLPVQYWRYASGALRGDLGESIRSNRPVVEVIAEQVPSTLQLTMVAIPLAVAIGLGLGLIAALKRGSWLDTAIMAIAISGISIPSFWLGLLLILLFAVTLGWLPSAAPSSDWRGLILPAVTLAAAEGAVISRVTRASLLEVFGQQYLLAARARGVRARSVVLRHALPNALIPVVTILGLQIGFLLVGSIVVETIFARQGLGRLAITAINSRDFPLVQGIVLVTASAYVIINTLTDLLYAVIDPRVRLQ
jgi:ABC-type dipeptide/oligopeptide/nickel transport system permease component